MNTNHIKETISSLNQMYGYSIAHQKIKLIEFAEYFCSEHLYFDELQELKVSMINHLNDVATNYCGVDDELWSAIYIAGFNDITRTNDFSFGNYFRSFCFTKRTLYLYNKFKTFLKDNSSTDVFIKEFDEIVKNFTSQPEFTPNCKYSKIRETLQNSTDKVYESHIGFVPAMINESEFRKMYADYLDTLANYSVTIKGQLAKDRDVSSAIASHYLFEASETESVKVLFITCCKEIVGFCILVEYPQMYYQNCVFAIDQFYIKEQYRGLGIAEVVAKKIFKMYGGKGVLDILTENIPARKFWNDIFTKYAKNIKIEEYEDDNGKDKEIYTYTFYTCVKE